MRGNLLGVGRVRIEMKRQQVAVGACRIGLIEDGFAVRQLAGAGIVEAAHAGHRAEVVIERAVLLHQQHDVLDIAERTGGRL